MPAMCRYYGCGLIAPEALEGARVLDLGSGAGMDCFVLSKLVGQHGHVTGLDMTDEQVYFQVIMQLVLVKEVTLLCGVFNYSYHTIVSHGNYHFFCKASC